MLVHKYELFKIEPNESISGMFIRFTDIINNLKNLGRAYTDDELCRKKYFDHFRIHGKLKSRQSKKQRTCQL